MRCWLFTFTMSMAIINYVLGIPVRGPTAISEVHGYHLSEDYTSGDINDPKTLAGLTTKLKRSLVAGDTFTPQEMLPIAEKLLNQVEEPGYGQGFVSSARGPQELADKLFETFFFSTKRIVTLKDQDIIGIDALQALALEGQAADHSLEEEEEVTEAAQKMYLRGQLIDVKKSKPLKSHYKLVTKVIPIPKKIKRKLKKGKRRGIPLAKKLPPKRHLVVNQRPHLRNGTQKINNKYKKVTQRVDIINTTKNRSPPVKKKKEGDNNKRKKANCRWKYVCSIPSDLDTCRVHTTCGNASSPVTPAQKRDDKKDKLLDQFRRMVGITTVDEEVEKILEVRNLKVRPVNLEAIEKVESLAEFFNNIIARENMESTAPLPTEHILDGSDEPLTPKPSKGLTSLNDF